MQASAGVLIGKEALAFTQMAKSLANWEYPSSLCIMDECLTTRHKCFHVSIAKTGFEEMKSTFLQGLLFQFEEFFFKRV